jgi:hypothetical protein
MPDLNAHRRSEASASGSDREMIAAQIKHVQYPLKQRRKI